MKARDIMTTNPATVSPETRARQAAQVMKDADVGVVPVVEAEGDDRRVVGLLTDRDLAIRLVAEGRDPDRVLVRELMSTNPRTARADDDVEQIMELMGREQVRRVPIVDERGALVGIVAQADLVLETRNDRKAEGTIEKISRPGGKHST